MRPELNDIRLLKLAEMYESAYERFILELAARVVDDPQLRAGLGKLTDPNDRHGERIVAELERLNAKLGPADKPGVVRAALLDVADVERSARDFYARNADRVHDGRVAKLFRELAQEEGRHLHIAEDLLRIAARGVVGAGADLAGMEALRLLTDPDAMLLREGVTDFGTHHLHRDIRPEA
ncbi:MAG TPA: hypothetical protein VGR28_05825 [Candidatus Thermoplasmatota archaeon]|jgi:rubrerythrin|nr:hypothetical protein [Candidatus Thermoplasmatota archaeon]